MIEHLSNIQISLYMAFIIALSFTLCCVVCLIIGYILGRNSAEKPVITDKKPKQSRISDDEVVISDDGDYFINEIPDLEEIDIYKGRVPTMI